MGIKPTCVNGNPYRGGNTSYHPDAGPLDVNHDGHVIWGCPNCGLRTNTKMTEAEVYKYIGLPMEQRHDH